MSTSQIEIEASEWLAKEDADEVTPALLEAIGAWRAEDPRHEVAYLRLKAGWGRLDRLQALRPPATQRIDPDLSARLPQPEIPAKADAWRGSLRDRTAARFIPLRRALIIAVAAVVALAVIGIVWTIRFRGVERYVTSVGGFERVVLADGSVAQLNTATELRTSFTGNRRSVELVRGEATFNAARDVSRPFVVTAGQIAVRAIGTQFNVRLREEGHVDVIVTEGEVAVGSPATAAIVTPESSVSLSKTQGAKFSEAPFVLAGQFASVRVGQMQVRTVPQAETTRQLAWQSGMLVFTGEPLADVINEFNRYNARQLVVSDARIASLKIGGDFKATNLDVFVDVLESSFGVCATQDGDRITLRASEPIR